MDKNVIQRHIYTQTGTHTDKTSMELLVAAKTCGTNVPVLTDLQLICASTKQQEEELFFKVKEFEIFSRSKYSFEKFKSQNFENY